MATPAKVLGTLASDLRDSVERAYRDTPRAPEAPNVQIRHGLNPPHDCEDSCFISYEVIQRAASGNETPCIYLPAVRFRIEVVRCWPAKHDPDAEEQASQLLNDDATTLIYGLSAQVDNLFASYPAIGCQSVVFEDMRPREPLGERAGWYWRVLVDLAGHSFA